MKKWYVYIIQADNKKLYTGITTDLMRRFEQHRSGKGAKFFRVSKPQKIVFYERQSTRSRAQVREAEIKQMTRRQKLLLIGNG